MESVSVRLADFQGVLSKFSDPVEISQSVSTDDKSIISNREMGAEISATWQQ
jgi:hypothetical protein